MQSSDQWKKVLWQGSITASNSSIQPVLKLALKILTKEFPFRNLKNITFKFLHLKSITNTIISTKNNVHIIKASLSDTSLLKHSCSTYLLCTIPENFILRRGNTIIKLWLNDSQNYFSEYCFKMTKIFPQEND